MKIQLPLRRILSATVLVCLPLHSRAANDQPATPEPDSSTIVLDTTSVTTIKERLKTYELAAKSFWYATQETRTVSYLDVICLAYAKAEFDLADALIKKKLYRDKMTARGYDFFCNYAAIQTKVPVRFRNKIGSAPGIGLSGPKEWVQYNFKSKSIVVERELYYSSLLQAAGLSLCGSPSPEALERIKKIGENKKDFEFRRQVNFEVQLQDLNRLYALYTKRPIMNPLEALEALRMLGEKPKLESVEAIFKRNGFKVEPALVQKILTDTKERQAVAMYDGDNSLNDFFLFGADASSASNGPANNGPESFLGAHRLLTGLNYAGEIINVGLRRLSGKEYEALLERILIEAPGHI
jgi:hypothetical protein